MPVEIGVAHQRQSAVWSDIHHSVKHIPAIVDDTRKHDVTATDFARRRKLHPFDIRAQVRQHAASAHRHQGFLSATDGHGYSIKQHFIGWIHRDTEREIS